MAIDISSTLLITDLDGTLLKDDKSISRGNIDFIKRWVKNGGYFSIATGRNIESASHRILELPINCPSILLNGCAIYDYNLKKLLYLYCLNNYFSIIDAVTREFPYVGIEVFLKDTIYLLNSNEVTDAHIARENLTHEDKKIASIPKEGALKILIGVSSSMIDEVQKRVDEIMPAGLYSVKTDINYIEILPKEVNKATGVKRLKDMLNVKRVIAFGDYYNDAEMLSEADFGFIMRNAPNDLKSKFKRVAKSNNADGVCAALKELESDGILNLKGAEYEKK